MGVQTAAGSKLYIGTTAESGAGDTFDPVAEIESIGEFGRQYEEIRFTAIDNRRTQKFKGAYDNGSLSLALGRDLSDDGQAALKAAAATDGAYNIKIELNDAPAGGTPTTFAFKARVMSFTANIGGVNDLVRAACTLSLTSDVTETPAAEEV